MSMLGTFRYLKPDTSDDEMLVFYETLVERNTARRAAVEID